jgi:ABC-type uncharacterized transport system ATPase subunit
VLLYTSELKEIQLVCDRAIVIFGGRVVGEVAVADADEPTLLRAAYNLRSDAQMPEEVVAEVVAELVAAEASVAAEAGAAAEANVATETVAAAEAGVGEPEPPESDR